MCFYQTRNSSPPPPAHFLKYVVLPAAFLSSILYFASTTNYFTGDPWNHVIVEVMSSVLSFALAYFGLRKGKETGDWVSFVIGIGFFVSSVMDMFHAFFTFYSIRGYNNFDYLIPQTWVFGRITVAMTIFLAITKFYKKENKLLISRNKTLRLIALASIASIFIMLISLRFEMPYVIIHSVIRRPYEIISICLGVASVLFFYKNSIHRSDDPFYKGIILTSVCGIFVNLFIINSITIDDTFIFSHMIKISQEIILILYVFQSFIWFERKQIKVLSDYKKSKEQIVTKEKIIVNQLQEIQTSQVMLNNIKKALDESSLVAITDKNGTITYANKKFCEVSEYSEKELIGQNHRILKSGFHTPKFYEDIWATITSGRIWTGDLKNISKHGRYYWVKTIIVPFLDQNGIPEQYIAIRTEITDQKKTEELLRRALDELKETDKLKDEFASMISHELKTPLIPIMGYCEMLMDPSLNTGLKESQIESIREIHKNSKRLLKMIEDILTVQKMEMRQIKFEKKDVQLIPFMKNIMESYTPAMREKMIKFTNATSENHIFRSDPDKLTQIFGNLIQNAVDFVPYNGMIEIGAKSDGNSMVFHVKDDGLGIPKEKQGDLFSKFYQVDTSMKRKHGGTGLGLSICKEIVEGLGGRIWVESEEGRGTTFYFTVSK